MNVLRGWTSSVVAAGMLALVGVASASETRRSGGPGGERTVVMDCGSNAFIVGASATGGKDTLIAPNLVRTVQFRCRTFDGTTPGASTTKTTTARASGVPTTEMSDQFGDCPTSMAVSELDLFAGLYIDRFDGFTCLDPTLEQRNVFLKVGGGGGDRSGIACPPNERLYRVDARVGSAIDSLKGYCRAFGSMEQLPSSTQIDESLRPEVSREAPVKIGPGQSRTFDFSVPATGTNQKLLLLISTQTDLLGGGRINLPEYKLEITNPSGDTVTTKIVSGEGSDTMQNVPVSFGVAGAWKLRVTNLKENYGALDVIKLSITPDVNKPVRRKF